jgi:CHAT domain-containing protein
MRAGRPRSQERANAPVALLAVGNPALGGEAVKRVKRVKRDAKLGPLPEAEAEVRRLARLYGVNRSRVYVGAAAREERVKAGAGSARVLHFATHGVLNDASPMYSHILLAQAEGNPSEDGLLEAWEMMDLELSAELVVLSACETARGRIGAGEGVIGLTWALFVAGCPTTVATQWEVDSHSTSALMVEFHRRLQSAARNPRPAIGKAEALRQAQLMLLRRNREYRHPFYWAGFVLVGEGG